MLAGSPPAFLEYLEYTNKHIENIVANIQAHNLKAVIILMSDHGHRSKVVPGPFPLHLFKNLNAVYIPGIHYRYMPEHITGVNQFRVVFNRLFKQQFPLTKDSVILLRDVRPPQTLVNLADKH